MTARAPAGLRVVYLHQYFNTPAMPGSTRSYEFARRLAQHGHDVHVVTSDRRAGARRRRERCDGVTVHWIPVPYANAMPPRQRLLAFVRFAVRAGRVARGLRPDVVLASSTPLTVALPGLGAVAGTRVPMVFEVRDLWPAVPVALGVLRHPLAVAAARALERLAYRHATRVIALSEGMRAGVQDAGYPADLIRVVPNAADVALFRDADGAALRRRLPWLGDRPLVVYAGTFGRVNGVDYLVRLAARVRTLDPDVRFLLVGDGAEYDAVRDLARSRGVLDETMAVWPSRPKAAMPPVLAAATLTVSTVVDVPALEANSANKVFDSFAAGRPVAVNHGGWIADLLRDSGAGLVLDRDPDRAARELVGALRTPGWSRRAGDAAATLADGPLGRDELFRRFEATLQEAAAEGRRRHRLTRRPAA